MTDTELDTLESLAKAATPGPWEYDDADEDMAALGTESQLVKDAAYIAAVNPIAVLDLIAELRQTKELCKEHELYIAELEQSGKIYDKKIGKLSKLLGIEHEEGNYSELVCIYQFVELLQKELRQAKSERDWLAEHRPARYCPTVEKWETCLVDVPGHKLPKACIQCWIDRAKEVSCPQI